VTLTLDHLVVGAADLDIGRAWAREVLGVEPIIGGRHAFMGTHNLVLRLDDPDRELYLEILAIDPDAPDPARRRWFGLDEQAVRAPVAVEPQLLAWVARSDDLDADRGRLVEAGADPGPIHAAERETPTGTLRWRITIREDGRRLAGGAIQTLIAWGTPSPARSLSSSGVSLERLVVRGVSPEVGVLLREAGAGTGAGDHPRLAATLRRGMERIELRAP
jgi:hypothetical protein